MVQLVLVGRPRDLGDGMVVRRILPQAARRWLGPFVFIDHFGPIDLDATRPGMAVRPHPHIGLSTVTYLYEGAITHRDSLGHERVIRPGAVNWMRAGRGIVHSERTEEPIGRLHGLQIWMALPDELAESDPAFVHHPADTLPTWTTDGASLRLLVGRLGERASPLQAPADAVYVDLTLADGAQLSLPREHEELGVYVVAGEVEVNGRDSVEGELVVLSSETDLAVRAKGPARLALFGGEPVGHRHMWWNFVASSRERIEQAKRDWKEGRFPAVPGDDEFIPLPE